MSLEQESFDPVDLNEPEQHQQHGFEHQESAQSAFQALCHSGELEDLVFRTDGHLHESLKSIISTASKFWMFFVRDTFSCTSDLSVRPSMYPCFTELWHFSQFTLRVTSFSRVSGFDKRILYSPTSSKFTSIM
jgi:hypothetical protein